MFIQQRKKEEKDRRSSIHTRRVNFGYIISALVLERLKIIYLDLRLEAPNMIDMFYKICSYVGSLMLMQML